MRQEHCCQRLRDTISDPRYLLIYMPHIRGYFLPKTDRSPFLSIKFCPWCGIPMRPSLHAKWFELFFEYLEDGEAEKFPEEATTDEWWKKRGL